MKISKLCYAVTGLGYSAPWCVNAGFIVGNQTTLVVDTGGNTLAAASIHGYATAVRPTNSLRALNTENHFDHIGGNSFFKSQGVEIWGHVGLRRTQKEFDAEILEFNDGILNPARRARKEASVFFTGTTLALPDHTIESDTDFDLGGCRIQILLTPGHTNTNISVWVPEDRVLFSGDCLINEYLPNLDAGTPQDWQTWLHSLDRIESLCPAVVVAGHGPIASTGQVQYILENVRQILHQALKLGHSPTALATSI